MKNFAGIEQILASVNAIHEQYEQQKKASGESFNLFWITGVGSDETRVHSKLLADILNPKGSHKRGSVFLELFLKNVELLNSYNDELSMANVLTEYSTGKINGKEGRVDILIQFGSKAILIENKIHAADQEEQLERYYKFASSRYGNRFHLLYLNLDGHLPSKSSLGGVTINQYLRVITYRQNILNWLEESIKKCEENNYPSSIAGALLQYINLIKKLMNQTMSDQELKETSQIIFHSERISDLQYSWNVFNETKRRMEKLFWRTLILELQAKSKKLYMYTGERTHSELDENWFLSGLGDETAMRRGYGISFELKNNKSDSRIFAFVNLISGFTVGVYFTNSDGKTEIAPITALQNNFLKEYFNDDFENGEVTDQEKKQLDAWMKMNPWKKFNDQELEIFMIGREGKDDYTKPGFRKLWNEFLEGKSETAVASKLVAKLLEYTNDIEDKLS